MLNIDIKEISYIRYFVADDGKFDKRVPEIIPDDVNKMLKENPYVISYAYFSRVEGVIQWENIDLPIKSPPFKWSTKIFKREITKMELGYALKRFPTYAVSKLASEFLCPFTTTAAVVHSLKKIYLARETWYGDD